ncbi:MAG: CopG family transcriptional regulator [Firmicutes bacterium]|nr:CopG family transcriptional regulator [Bacillota bacterium]
MESRGDRRRKQVYLEADQDEELSSLALATGRSESSIIREALEEYLVKQREKSKATTHPLARLLEMEFQSAVADGSERHDRDLYAAPRTRRRANKPDAQKRSIANNAPSSDSPRLPEGGARP